MSRAGQCQLSPAYDVTFCEGPGGYHQMDVMGEALAIDRRVLLRLAEEVEVLPQRAGQIIDGTIEVANQFSAIAEEILPQAISPATLRMIQGRIGQNVRLLR